MKRTAKHFACKLTTAELQKRKATIISELTSLVQVKKELSNGFTYQFEATDAVLDKLNTFIKTERLCCDFFIFKLTVAGKQTVLNITGPIGSKEFLEQEVEF